MMENGSMGRRMGMGSGDLMREKLMWVSGRRGKPVGRGDTPGAMGINMMGNGCSDLNMGRDRTFLQMEILIRDSTDMGSLGALEFISGRMEVCMKGSLRTDLSMGRESGLKEKEKINVLLKEIM